MHRFTRVFLSLIAVALVISATSCQSAPAAALTPENLQFERDTGIKIVYLLRGLYSMGEEFGDPDYPDFQDAIGQGKVTFVLGDEGYRVKVETGEVITVRVGRSVMAYEGNARWIYFNSLMAPVAKMVSAKPAPDLPKVAANAFYAVVALYQGIAGQEKIAAEPWVVGKKLIVDGNEIR